MANALGNRRFTQAVTIASGASLSSAASLNNATLVGVLAPAAWTAAGLSFEVALEPGGTFYPVRDAAGDVVECVGFSAGDYILLPAGAFHGIAEIKVRSATSGSPVNQGAARTLTLVFRAFA